MLRKMIDRYRLYLIKRNQNCGLDVEVIFVSVAVSNIM